MSCEESGVDVSRSLFVCRQCAYQSAKWLGRCPECGEWGTLLEEPAGGRPASGPAAARVASPLAFPEIPTADAGRASTGLPELDRVLGGGLVAGMSVLVGGEPGIGKSTLLLQAASGMADAGRTVLYASGEESPAQLKLRGERLGVRSPALQVLAETDVDVLVESVRALSPGVMIVDSIQSVRCADLGSLPGSVSQVREAASRIVGLAKACGIPALLIGHVTKDGSLAGPRALEHLVDTVIQFEGDRHHAHRILRTLKNRFGPSEELGVFRMTDAGLREVASPSELFLAERPLGAPGSAVLAALEGSRPLLVEVQALVGEPVQGTPRRTSLGVDSQRTALILAVLQRRAGLELANRDVFVNVTGGLTVTEPAADLAVAAAVASSLRRRPIPERWTVIGEVGLTGEIRSVVRIEARFREAARLGFTHVVAPANAASAPRPQEVEVLPVHHLSGALEILFDEVG